MNTYGRPSTAPRARAFGLGTPVVGAAVSGVGGVVAGVETGGKQGGGQAFEGVTAVEAQVERRPAGGFLGEFEDREGAGPEAVERVVIAVPVGVAITGADLKATQAVGRGPTLDGGERIGIEFELRHPGFVASVGAGVALVGGDEVATAVGFMKRNPVGLTQAAHRDVLDPNAPVPVGRVETGSGKAVIHFAQSEVAGDRGGREVDDGHGVVFLKPHHQPVTRRGERQVFGVQGRPPVGRGVPRPPGRCPAPEPTEVRRRARRRCGGRSARRCREDCRRGAARPRWPRPADPRRDGSRPCRGWGPTATAAMKSRFCAAKNCTVPAAPRAAFSTATATSPSCTATELLPGMARVASRRGFDGSARFDDVQPHPRVDDKKSFTGGVVGGDFGRGLIEYFAGVHAQGFKAKRTWRLGGGGHGGQSREEGGEQGGGGGRSDRMHQRKV